jgi:TonB-linked SusC/RagA family outer membrane protein
MKKCLLTCFLVFLLIQLNAQVKQLTGKVLDDSTGNALPDVSVRVKGTSEAVRTAADGSFTLPLRAARNRTELVASSVGYKDALLVLNSDTGNSITIRLKREVNALEEVVVIGYGTVKRRDLTGSVASVKGQDVARIPTANPLESIQGKVAGVDITRSSGSATSGASITIRGNRSISGGNSPLYVIDGVQTGSINDINPNDIESIEFLKDASSTAIYGFQGANGIVMITTKKGRSGATKVSMNVYGGLSQVARYPAVMDGPAYVALKREANRTTGRWNSESDDPKIFNNQELNAIARNQWVDYQDLLIHNGSQQDYQVGVSGGTDKTRIYFSLDYYNEKGLFKLDWNHRYAARLNIDQTISKQLKAGIQAQVTHYDQSVRRDPLNQANKISPLGTVYDSLGNFIVYPLSGSNVNPLADEQPDVFNNSTSLTRVITNAYAEYKPVSGLTLRSNLGTSLGYSRNGIFAASTSIDRNGSLPRANYTSYNATFINWDNVVTYNKEIGNHSFTVTGITSYTYGKSDTVAAQGDGQLLPSQLFYALGNATQNIAIASAYSKTTSMSFAGRINYSYKGTYLLTLTDRADGVSRLSPGHKWSNFPSAAVAWRISNENFFKGITAVNDLKLRFSYGLTGNAQSISAYQTQSSLTRIAFAYGDASAQGFTFSPLIGNTDLGWEVSATADLGVDISLLKNRLSATVDLYDTKTRDIILPRGLPPTTGVTTVYQNIGKTRNRGIELQLNSVNIDHRNFKWNSALTFTRNKEEITELVTQGVNDIGNGWFIGYPTSVYYDYEKLGIWQTGEASAAQVYGQKPGDIKVKDQNGDKQISASNDRVILGTPRPKWLGGLDNTIRYKNFDLNVYVFARFGQMIRADFLRRYDPQGIFNSSAGLNYWTPENPSNDYPRPNANLSLATMLYTSSLGYEDGSFIRVRNISLGYTFPKKALGNSFISSLRVYATARNLFTWTKSSALKNYDPERGGSENFPMTKLYVVGLNVEF